MIGVDANNENNCTINNLLHSLTGNEFDLKINKHPNNNVTLILINFFFLLLIKFPIIINIILILLILNPSIAF